jgi:imidazolonepropionase-like amidohydrolase
MRRARFVLTAALSATLVASAALAQNQTRPANERPLVIRGGLLIDGTGATPVPNSVITIVNGRIQGVGREGSVTIPADAVVIDATGKTVLPGLVDSHVHLRNYHIQDYLYWGVTTVGDLGNSPGWLTAYRDAVEQGRATGSYILNGGNRFNAPLKPEFVNNLDAELIGNSGNAPITDAASAEREVAKAKQVRQDAIKMRDRLTPAQMKMVIEIAHKQGLPVFAHFDSANTRQGQPLTGIDEIADTGLDVAVHLFGLIKATAPPEVVDRIRKGGPAQGWDQLNTAKFAPIIQKLVANRMYVNPTIASQFEKASKYLPEFDKINTSYVNSPMGQSAPKPVRDRYALSFKPGPEANAAVLAEGYKRAGQFVKQFAEAGGKIISGTDSDAGRIGTSGLTLHEEMMMLSEAGVPAMKVIQSSTGWAMEAWGKGKEAGTLEAGRRADVLVLNRNPLDDMHATMDIFRIVQGGQVIDREGLASKRQEIVPRPGLVAEGFANPALKVPFIDEIWPELIATRDKPAPVTIKGSHFSKSSFVLFNDQIVRGTVRGDNELQINIPAGLTKAAGVYPLVVVQPGSAGGVSNTFYFMVTTK